MIPTRPTHGMVSLKLFVHAQLTSCCSSIGSTSWLRRCPPPPPGRGWSTCTPSTSRIQGRKQPPETWRRSSWPCGAWPFPIAPTVRLAPSCVAFSAYFDTRYTMRKGGVCTQRAQIDNLAYNASFFLWRPTQGSGYTQTKWKQWKKSYSGSGYAKTKWKQRKKRIPGVGILKASENNEKNVSRHPGQLELLL